MNQHSERTTRAPVNAVRLNSCDQDEPAAVSVGYPPLAG